MGHPTPRVHSHTLFMPLSRTWQVSMLFIYIKAFYIPCSQTRVPIQLPNPPQVGDECLTLPTGQPKYFSPSL